MLHERDIPARLPVGLVPRLRRKMSPKHLNRDVTEFQGRHNDRENDTIDHMGHIVEGMGGKRLTYEELIAPNGLDSGARGA